MRFFGLGTFVLALCAAHAAWSTDVVVRAPDGLREDLEQASLALQVADDPDSKTRDILAAARADYERLIGVLYAAGYYSPTIRITADGQEVSGLSVFARDRSY